MTPYCAVSFRSKSRSSLVASRLHLAKQRHGRLVIFWTRAAAERCAAGCVAGGLTQQQMDASDAVERAWCGGYRGTRPTFLRYFGTFGSELFGVVPSPKLPYKLKTENLDDLETSLAIRLAEVKSVVDRIGLGTKVEGIWIAGSTT